MNGSVEHSVRGHHVGLFGLLGSGNIGNDASMKAVLRYLQNRHPSAVIDAMCSGPETVTETYGIDAVQMFCFDRYDRVCAGPLASILRLPSRILDLFRISAWVRQHDIVIVPGAGVLEASLPLRPWNTPYGLFLLSASGKLFRTKVAFVSVGASTRHVARRREQAMTLRPASRCITTGRPVLSTTTTTIPRTRHRAETHMLRAHILVARGGPASRVAT